MKRSITLFTFVLLAAFSCVPKAEKEKLEMENEELKAELTRAKMAATTLEEVGALMDSIDVARNALELNLEAGTEYDDYLKKMNNINSYVKNTEAKIAELEKNLNKTNANNQAYIRAIKRLKKDLAGKTQEIKKLQQTVENYKKENSNLLNTVDLKETEIMDLQDQIDMKMEELNLLENRVQEVMKSSQMTEADSYYTLGEALEEAARRTKLAPKKKKETYREAIEYYKKSLALGREDAQEKIDALQKKI